MTVAAGTDDLGLSLGPVETVRVLAISIVAVWIQIFMIETHTLGLKAASVEISMPLSLVMNVPLAVVATVTVRQAGVAPWFGFALGLLVDCYEPTMFGFHAGLYCVAAAVGPQLLGGLKGVRTLVSGTAAIGFFLVGAKWATTAVVGSLDHSAITVVASTIITTAMVVVFAYPIAGFLDRRTRRMRYLNRSVANVANSPLQRMRLLLSMGRR